MIPNNPLEDFEQRQQYSAQIQLMICTKALLETKTLSLEAISDVIQRPML
jgi:hypothetical protein